MIETLTALHNQTILHRIKVGNNDVGLRQRVRELDWLEVGRARLQLDAKRRVEQRDIKRSRVAVWSTHDTGLHACAAALARRNDIVTT